MSSVPSGPNWSSSSLPKVRSCTFEDDCNSNVLIIGKITEEKAKAHAHLKIVGMVGSIDNDMSMTDLTIGAPTALHRICEAIDNINSTAYSHSRAFVIEVMGRHCGWLGLLAGVASVVYLILPCP